MVPPLDHFQGKIKIAHLLPEGSAHQDDHFLQTWPLLSGALGFDNIKVIGPEEMPILVWGRRKRPPTKMGST